LDLERGGMRDRSGRKRVWRERRFAALGKNNLLSFFGTLSRFQPSLGASHEDLVLDVILEAIGNSFLEKVLDM
jgi:hypothetical protein